MYAELVTAAHREAGGATLNPKRGTIRSDGVVNMFGGFQTFQSVNVPFPAGFGGPGGFEKLREACRIHFHQSWYI